MGEAVFKREQVAKRRAERAKIACRISEEKVEKFKIALVLSWVMFGALLILSTRLREVGNRQRQWEHEVEVANEELKQARAMREVTFERKQATKRRAERAKVAHRIFEEKAEKFKIVLILSWVMFGVLLILSTRLGEVRSRQKCLLE
nr:hypothetical protein CFP56_08621 [Quercus suber]